MSQDSQKHIVSWGWVTLYFVLLMMTNADSTGKWIVKRVVRLYQFKIFKPKADLYNERGDHDQIL